jgi:hypothetical protein
MRSVSAEVIRDVARISYRIREDKGMGKPKPADS